MSTISLAQEAGRIQLADRTSFYVPQYALSIEGQPHLIHDVVKIVYKDSLDKFDSATITLSNWDEENFRFKYIGSETQAELDSGAFGGRYKLFDPCGHVVTLKMGYLGKNPGPPSPETDPLKTMLTGRIVALTPSFTELPPTLEISVLNQLFELRRRKNTRRWSNKKSSEVAREMGQDRARFPLPVTIDSTALGNEVTQESVSQDNQYDIDFLLKLAEREGYVVFLEEADTTHPRQLYFGPSSGRRPPGMRADVFRFDWGKSLMEFKPTLSTAGVFESVTVRSWRHQAYSCIEATARLSELSCNADLLPLLGCGERREEKVVRRRVTSRADAMRQAQALLLESLKSAVVADVKIMGLPDIRAGRRVEIGGVGVRLSGTYFVTETTHTLDDNGYITEFKARRENACT
jgi:uncharacterized protein